MVFNTTNEKIFERFIELHCNFISINSVNPAYHSLEDKRKITNQVRPLSYRVLQLMQNLLTKNKSRGKISSRELPNCTSNTYLYLDFGCEETLCIDCHIDTVQSIGMKEPFTPRIQNGRLYGLGSVDTKPSIAGAIALIEWGLKTKTKFRYNIVLAATNDEEFGSTGAPVFAKWLEEQKLWIHKMIVADTNKLRSMF